MSEQGTQPAGAAYHVGPDEQADKYRLVRQFGAGGEAQLWRAEIAVAGEMEPVAVKVLRPERMEEFARLSARWSEQAELLRFVRHPGVVGVREHFEGAPSHPAGAAAETTGRSLYLVMNWVEGHSLRDWVLVNTGREGMLAALGHLEQVADVLDWLHSGRATPSHRVVVHGDLSPGNVMITPAGQATLVDFGLVRIAASHHTRTAMGTPGYTAPEVWASGEYTPAVDRYSFGALGYFLLSGQTPPSRQDELRAGLSGLALLSHGTPETTEELMRIFAEDPLARPSASDWVRTLRSAATTAARVTELAWDQAAAAAASPGEEATGGPTAAVATQRSAPGGSPGDDAPEEDERRRRWPWLAGAGAVVVIIALVAAAVVALAQRGAPDRLAAAHQPAPTTAAPTSAPPRTTEAAGPIIPGFGAAPSTSAPPDTAAPGAPVEPGQRYLSDIDPVDNAESYSGQWVAGQYTSNGKQFLHSVDVEAPCASDDSTFWVDYDLGRSYSTFRATVGLSDNDASDAKGAYAIYADGKKVTQGTLGVGETKPVELDVSGVLRLRLEGTNANVSGDEGCTVDSAAQADVVFGDARIS
jgi:serine/threonine protein kinase